MKARHQALLGQALHVAAHGLQRHAQGLGEMLHAGAAVLADMGQQLELAGIVVHGRRRRGEGFTVSHKKKYNQKGK
ncbi:hypothetical protein ALISP_5119 [Alicycliphilus sp. B1]|nr:hypothetical protein ALISP_5119 [Alicycliphilus sp. B1]